MSFVVSWVSKVKVWLLRANLVLEKGQFGWIKSSVLEMKPQSMIAFTGNGANIIVLTQRMSGSNVMMVSFCSIV